MEKRDEVALSPMFLTSNRFSLWNRLYIELGDQRDALSLCIWQLLIIEAALTNAHIAASALENRKREMTEAWICKLTDSQSTSP